MESRTLKTKHSRNCDRHTDTHADDRFMMNYVLSKDFEFGFSFFVCFSPRTFSKWLFRILFEFLTDHRWEFIRCLTQLDFLLLDFQIGFQNLFFFSSHFGCHFLFDSIDSLRMNFCLRRLFWKYTLEWWIIFFSFAFTYDGFEWFLSVCPWWCGRGAYLHSTMLIKWIWFDRIN